MPLPQPLPGLSLAEANAELRAWHERENSFPQRESREAQEKACSSAWPTVSKSPCWINVTNHSSCSTAVGVKQEWADFKTSCGQGPCLGKGTCWAGTRP